jgi:hypothetical protein
MTKLVRIAILPGLALAAAAAAAPPSGSGPPADAKAILQQAGEMASRADRAAEQGFRRDAIRDNLKALKLVEDAIAAGANPAEVEPGKRMIQLDTAECMVTDRRSDEARAIFAEIAAAPPGGLGLYTRVRALKGLVSVEAAAGDIGKLRTAMDALVRTGREMLAGDPHNTFLTRQLAEFLEGETFLRYWTDNGEAGMRAAAAETLDLFRAVAAANPDSEEARRAQFVWAWRNARMTNGVPLWKEAVDTGTWLESRKALKGGEPMLAEARRKMAAYERKGMINLGD